MSKQKKNYSPTFKRNAVKLAIEKSNVSEPARSLGLRPQMLYRWKKEQEEFEHNSFPGRGK